MSDINESEKVIKIDGKEVDKDTLNEMQNRTDIRLHQESEDSFRTLHHLNG